MACLSFTESFWLLGLKKIATFHELGQQYRTGGLKAYLLDADVFIPAENLHYGLDLCPAFWDWLTLRGMRARETVRRRAGVGDEVQAMAYELSESADRARSKFFFFRPDASVFFRHLPRSRLGQQGQLRGPPPYVFFFR